MPITIWIPGLRTPSVANLREHWAKRAQRVKDQRLVAGINVRAELPSAVTLPLRVRLVRVMPHGTLDDDNLRAALKAVRDGVADGLGLRDDRQSPMLTWDYAQALGEQGVRIEIETGGTLRCQP